MISNQTLLLLLLLGISNEFYSQEKSYYPSHITYRKGIGFITNHSPSMLYYTAQHLNHHEITFEKSNLLNSNWGHEYQNSNYGFGLSYYDFNTTVLGSGISFYPYLNFKFLQTNKISFKLRTAIGIGYIEKPFDEITNYKNSAIGSHFNLYFNFLGEFKWQFHERFALNFAADFGHFSNTSFQKPNLGINIPSFNYGITYSFGEKSIKQSKEERSFEKKSFYTQVSAGFGISEIYPANGEKYLAKFLAIHRVKQMNPKSSLFYGLEYFHNPAVRELLRRDSTFINNGWETSQLGLAIGHYLHLGKFALGNTLGYYLKNNNPDYPSFYLGISGNYALNEKWTVYTHLKTHKAEAEYLLIGFRFSFHE